MRLKFVCFTKRFLIVLIAVVLLAAVDAAPNDPLLFAAFALAAVVAVRLLWRSAEKDERRMARRRRFLHRRSGDMPQTFRRAA